MPSEKKAGKTGGAHPDPAKVKVATTVHLTRETLELLRDVALARHISDIGALNKHERVKTRNQPNISDIISDIVDRHRPALEDERERTLGRKRG
jgi:hypothetical protein